MKSTKTNKGITIIALIITIVVLLIIAAVAISSIQNDGILRYAENAVDNWNKAQSDEETVLQNYLNHIDKNTGVIVEPKVGQYVEYDVSYTDIYNTRKTFGKTDGWRYLGKDGENHLLISTGIPMILYYNSTADTNSAKWWDDDDTLNASVRATNGMLNKLADIPYAKVSAGTTSTSNKNTMIGLFGEDTRTTVGDYFKVTGKSYSDGIKVRTLTLAELNRAVNSAMNTQIDEGTPAEGFKNIPAGNIAYGLFDMQDLTGYTANYSYWMASPDTGWRR